MRILLTNDDGIGAPGLYVLEKIAGALSDDIWICAPSEEQSGAGHSLTLTRPVRLREHAPRRYSVTGTPTDAVTMALKKLMPAPPDLILSGVNRGANLGDDVTYSGTVSAAFAVEIRFRRGRLLTFLESGSARIRSSKPRWMLKKLFCR